MGWARHCQAGCHVHGQVLLARLDEVGVGVGGGGSVSKMFLR